MGSVETAARQLYAAQKADARIPEGHTQRDELEAKQAGYEHQFNATVFGLFDKVLFPIQRTGRDAQLAPKPLDMTRDATTQFDGEEQIEKTLVSDPIKLYLDVEKHFDAIRDKAEDLLWPENQDETRWSDAADRYAEQPAMVWLPPKALDVLKTIACNRGLWEDLGNGYVHEEAEEEAHLRTNRARARARGRGAGAPAGQHAACRSRAAHPLRAGLERLRKKPGAKGQPLFDHGAARCLPRVRSVGPVRDGRPCGLDEPARAAQQSDRRCKASVASHSSSLHAARSATRSTAVSLATARPTRDRSRLATTKCGSTHSPPQMASRQRSHSISRPQARLASTSTQRSPHASSRARPTSSTQGTPTFEGLKQADDKTVQFENVRLTIGQGAQTASITIGQLRVDAPFLAQLLKDVGDKFPPDAPITMAFQKAHFASGHDLEQFCQKVGLKVTQGSVEQ